MRQTNLYKRLLHIKKMKSFPIIKSLIPAIFFLLGTSFTSIAQTPPAFVAGHHQTLAMCESSAAVDVSSMMDITDPDAGDVEQWDTVAGPRNGILNGFPNANLATGGVTSITGVTYQPNPGFSGLDSFTIWVTDGTFNDTTTVVVTVNPLPVVPAIVGPSTVCIGARSVMTNDSTGGVWTLSGTGATSGSSSASADTVTGLVSGVDTIFYTVTLGSCSTMVFKPVTVQPMPFAGSISGGRFVCTGDNITLTDPAPGGVWSATNTSASVVGGTVTGIVNGVDTIRYTVTNGCGTRTASRVVTVNSVAYVSPISGPNTVCPSSTITLTDPDGGGVWTASNGNATVAGTSGDVTGVTVGVDTITYSLTLSCGTATATYEVSVNVTPDPGVISGPTSVCVGSTITLSETVAGSASLVVFWSSSNAKATISTSGDVTGVAPGLDTIRYDVFGPCGNADTTYVIQVLPAPDGGIISGLDSVCVGTSVALTESLPGGSWSASNSNATVTSAGPFTGSVIGVAAGAVTISYSIFGVCGTGVTIWPMTVMPQPVPGIITGPSSVCEATTIVLNDVSPGGVWTASNGHATIGSTGVTTGISAGVDIMTYTVTNYCATVQATVSVTVNPQPVAGSISGAGVLCVGNSITLTDPAPGGLWSNSNMHALATSGTVTGLSLGIDTISYSVTNICGTAIATHAVTVNDVPPVNPITGLAVVCADATIALTETTSGGTWSSSGPEAGVSSAGIVNGVSLGVVTISYTVTDMCGSVTQTKTVSVDVAPVAGTITGPSVICPHELIPLSASVTGGTWSIDNGLYALLDADGNIDGINPGISVVTYTVHNHCGNATTSFTIRIRPLDSCLNNGVHGVYATGDALKVFPNPSNGSFSVTIASDITENAVIIVTNLVGAKIEEIKSTTNKETLMQVNAPAGIYFVNVSTEHGAAQAKIVIQ